jgi:hypothetical protein
MKRKGRRHLGKVRATPAPPPDENPAHAAENWFLRFPEWPIRRNGAPYPSMVPYKVTIRWAGFVAIVTAATHLHLHRRRTRR